MLQTLISLPIKSQDFVWPVTYGHQCTWSEVGKFLLHLLEEYQNICSRNYHGKIMDAFMNKVNWIERAMNEHLTN